MKQAIARLRASHRVYVAYIVAHHSAHSIYAITLILESVHSGSIIPATLGVFVIGSLVMGE